MSSSKSGNRSSRSGYVAGFDLVLLDEAARSATRAKEAAGEGDTTREAGGSASAILCAAAACEALLSEELTGDSLGEQPTEVAARVRKSGSPHERWKEFLKGVAPTEKYHERDEYQNLACLFKVRNHIAHRHARWLPQGEWPDKLAGCIAQERVSVRVAGDTDWTSVLFVHEVGEWAHQVALTWMQTVAWHTPNARTGRVAVGRDPLLRDYDIAQDR